jgi:hypothetical protein
MGKMTVMSENNESEDPFLSGIFLFGAGIILLGAAYFFFTISDYLFFSMLLLFGISIIISAILIFKSSTERFWMGIIACLFLMFLGSCFLMAYIILNAFNIVQDPNEIIFLITFWAIFAFIAIPLIWLVHRYRKRKFHNAPSSGLAEGQGPAQGQKGG